MQVRVRMLAGAEFVGGFDERAREEDEVLRVQIRVLIGKTENGEGDIKQHVTLVWRDTGVRHLGALNETDPAAHTRPVELVTVVARRDEVLQRYNSESGGCAGSYTQETSTSTYSNHTILQGRLNNEQEGPEGAVRTRVGGGPSIGEEEDVGLRFV